MEVGVWGFFILFYFIFLTSQDCGELSVWCTECCQQCSLSLFRDLENKFYISLTYLCELREPREAPSVYKPHKSTERHLT